MLNFHNEFGIFNDKIRLSEARKNRIRISKNAVREKIKDYFIYELNLSAPKFTTQGSFTISTTLNPLLEEEVDADDGIYLTHVNEQEKAWPIPSNVHSMIIDALKGHTQDGCESKTSCVRVLYKNFYHLDLPVYIMKEDEALLGQTSTDTWINSDAKDFKNWFYSRRKNFQNTKIIRYLKAWRDYSKAPFTSIELTIEGVNCFSDYTDRDDKAFLNTIERIHSKISATRRIDKPVSPYENLWGDCTNSEIDEKIDSFQQLVEDIRAALNNEYNSRASSIFIELFGDRFPRKNDEFPQPHQEFSSGAKPWRNH